MSSEAGRAYAQVQMYYGRDVAEFVPEWDDVLAYNVRAAFMRVLNTEPEPDEGDKHRAAMERAREATKRVREANPWLPV